VLLVALATAASGKSRGGRDELAPVLAWPAGCQHRCCHCSAAPALLQMQSSASPWTASSQQVADPFHRYTVCYIYALLMLPCMQVPCCLTPTP
jgi:hypothetical protein